MEANKTENNSRILLANQIRSRESESAKNEFIDQEHMVDYDAGVVESFSEGLIASPLLKLDKGLDSASSGGHEATSATNESKSLEELKQGAEPPTDEQILLRSVFVKNVDYSSTQDEIK